MSQAVEKPGTGIPTAEGARLARESSMRLRRHLEPGRDLRVRFDDGGQPGEELILPEGVGRLLADVLEQFAGGNAVRILPVVAELTTTQAAEILNVSRPFLIKELEAGKLPYHLTGTHRKVVLNDLLEYKRRVDSGRDGALDELARLTQELGEDD